MSMVRTEKPGELRPAKRSTMTNGDTLVVVGPRFHKGIGLVQRITGNSP